MTDVLGPDWWLGADGRWHPPRGAAAVATLEPGSGADSGVPAGPYPPVPGAVPSPSVPPSPYPGAQGQFTTTLTATPMAQSAVLVAPPARDESSEFFAGTFGGNAVAAHRLQRRRGRRAALGAALVLAGAAAGGAYYLHEHPAVNAVAADTPIQAMALVSSAVDREASVHVQTTVPAQGGAATYVSDTAAASGREAVTQGTSQLSSLAVAGTLYVEANQGALTSILRVPATAAHQLAGKWLSFPSTSAVYGTLVKNLTTGQLLQQMTPTGTVTKTAPTVVDGVRVVGLQGELPGGFTGTLYVSSTGSPLPVEEVFTTPVGPTTTMFSDWGESVDVTPPTDAVPGASVGLS